MYASDVMTTQVITVAPETTIQQLATLLSEHGISGVPVVDAGNHLIGIVSEGDLLHRTETGTERRLERRRPRWFDSFGAVREQAMDYVRSHANTVGDVMTRDVITVTESTRLDEIADLLEANRIRRVPVVRGGVLIGIISRANLVRALAATSFENPGARDSDDRTIRRSLLMELDRHDWASVWAADIIVKDGVVHLWCSDDRPEEQRRALRIAAENTAGVKVVEMHVVNVPMTPAL